jgi:putative flippase GtrA
MVYLLVTNLGATPKITMTLLYGVGAAIGFMGNRKLTFAHKGSLLGSGVRYIIAHCFGYLINLAILIVLVDKLGYPHQLVQAIAILVVAAFLFMVFKFFVFTDMDASNKGEQ